MIQFTPMNPGRFRARPWLLSCLVTCCVIGFAQSEIPAASPPNQPDESSQPLYAPPKKLTPRARVGGDMRGTDGNDPEVKALVPDHVGLTIKETPVVNWFLSKSTNYEVIVTLRDDRSPKAFQEKAIASPKQPGIYTINFKELGFVLEPNVQYKWFVSVIRDPNQHSNNSVAGGVIERCEFNACMTELSPVLTCSSEDDVIKNARAGLWYDAMGCLCNLIDADQKNANLRRLRARLLKDVGLNGVAEWDLRAIPVSR